MFANAFFFFEFFFQSIDVESNDVDFHEFQTIDSTS